MSQTDYRVNMPDVVRLALDPAVFAGKRAMLRNQNLNKEAERDYWEAQVDGQTFRFTPDGEPLVVPEGIADILLRQAQEWALARDEDGNILMRPDYDGDRVSLLKVVGKFNAATMSEAAPAERIVVESMKCAFCKKTFEDQEEYLAHTKGHMKDHDISFGELSKKEKTDKPDKKAKEEPVEA